MFKNKKTRELLEMKNENEKSLTKSVETLSNLKKDLESDSLDENELTLKSETITTLEKEISDLQNEGIKIEKAIIDRNEYQKNLVSTANTVVQKNRNDVRSTREYEQAFEKFIKSGGENTYVKSLSTADTDGTTANTGGVLVPTYVADKIEERIKEFGGILSQAKRASVSGVLRFPVLVSRTGAEATAEETGATEQENIFDSVTIDPKMVKEFLKVTDELMAMSTVDLMDYVANDFLTEIFMQVEKLMIFGPRTGDKKGPLGIVTADSKFVTEMDAQGTLDFSSIIRAAARTKTKKGAKKVIHMNEITWADNIASLVDSNNRPIYNQILNKDGFTKSINGYEVRFNDSLPTWEEAGANEYPILVLADNAYKLNAPKGYSPKLMIDQLTLANEGITRFIGNLYVGGDMVQLQGATKIKKGTAPAPAPVKKNTKDEK